MWRIIPFVRQKAAEGIFYWGEWVDFIERGIRGGFRSATGIIPINFLGIIDKGYSYSYNR